MGLYLESGYLNQKWIEEQADKNKISFIVEIGGRQVGKTFGTLELMLKEKKTFILMRRTITEMEFICNDINNPFTVFQGHSIGIRKDSKYTARITDCKDDVNTVVGSVMSLSSIAKIRGFNGSMYTDLVFDEFIPESHVTKIKDEGDAFLNAIVTISGNRELNDRPPLRCWMLANANTIASPILSALNIQNKVEEMKNKGQEISILRDRGIMIILPNSDQIMSRRKQTALMKAIDGSSRFSQMAFNNEFSYNDNSNIINVNMNEYRPLFRIAGQFVVNKHKSKNILYVSDTCRGGCIVFADTEREIILAKRKFANTKNYYLNGNILFQNLVLKEKFVEKMIN